MAATDTQRRIHVETRPHNDRQRFQSEHRSGQKGCSGRSGCHTDRGQAAHVLLSFEHYRELVKRRPGIAEILGGPPGVADIDFELPGRNDVARAAVFG